jgi:tripeptidyl-peptidase-1
VLDIRGVAGADLDEPPFLDWAEYLIAWEDRPRVISISYGDDERLFPESYARRVCNLFAQFGVLGVSVLVGSGDSGVAGGFGECLPQDGFAAVFPASCPWVTSVGATQDVNPEVATQSFGSGGGFSNYFTAPKYQEKAVKDYVLGLEGLHDGLYNRTGRLG